MEWGLFFWGNMPIILNCSPGTGDKKINEDQKSIMEKKKSFNFKEKLLTKKKKVLVKVERKRTRNDKLHSFPLLYESLRPVMSSSNWTKTLINCFKYFFLSPSLPFAYSTQKRVNLPVGTHVISIFQDCRPIVLVVIAPIRFRLKVFVNDIGYIKRPNLPSYPGFC